MSCPKPHYHIEPCGGNGGSGIGIIIVLIIVACIVSWLAKNIRAIESALQTILLIAIVAGGISLFAFVGVMIYITRPVKNKEIRREPIRVTSVRVNPVNEVHAEITDGSERIPDSVVSYIDDYRRER